MALSSLKIVSADYTGKDIAGLADVVQGQAATLKARFDSLVKDLVATRFNSLIDEHMEWSSVSVSSSGWSSDSTVPGYTYKQTITLSGCTSDMVVCVLPFADSGKFAAQCNTVSNGLELWSNSNTLSATIPLIKRIV